MRSVRRILLASVLVVMLTISAFAQEPVHWDAVGKIRAEGLERSQVMEIARQMTDVYGPRLSGSPLMREAEEWAKSQMEEWGLVNTALEPWGDFGIGWTNDYTSVHMLEPRYSPIIAYPKAWSSGTNGKITGNAVIVQILSQSDFAKYRGKLRNAIVLNGPMRPVSIGFEPDARRRTDEQLQQSAMYSAGRGRGGRGGRAGGGGTAGRNQIVQQVIATINVIGGSVVDGSKRQPIGHLAGTNTFSKAVTERSRTVSWIVVVNSENAYIQVTAASNSGGTVRTANVPLNR